MVVTMEDFFELLKQINNKGPQISINTEKIKIYVNKIKQLFVNDKLKKD
jgi:hypothetical protein